MFVFTSCKDDTSSDVRGSVNKEHQFVPIEGMIRFKFKTEDSLNLVISRLNHQNNYCSLSLYLEHNKKIIDKIFLRKLFEQCNPQVILKQDFQSIKPVVFQEAKTEVGLITFKLEDGSTYDLLIGHSNKKFIKLDDPIVFQSDQVVKNTLIVKDTALVYNSVIINKKTNTELSNTTKTLEVLGTGVLREQKIFPIKALVFKHTFENPDYTYSIEETKYNWRKSIYKSNLRKKGTIVDSNTLKAPEKYIETLYNTNEIKATYTDVSFTNVAALVEITNNGLGETWDGYRYSNMLFGYTKNNNLVNELYTQSEGGNTESDYSHSYMADEIFKIPSSEGGFYDRIIINKIGNETFYDADTDDQEGKTTQFYDIEEVYDYKNNQFVKDITGYVAYVTAKNGLSVRRKPGFTERLETLDYKAKVRIIARSKIDFHLKESNNRTVIGRWCKILYNDDKIGYVFDSYLSKIEPK